MVVNENGLERVGPMSAIIQDDSPETISYQEPHAGGRAGACDPGPLDGQNVVVKLNNL
jgi:hypothetical protein